MWHILQGSVLSLLSCSTSFFLITIIHSDYIYGGLVHWYSVPSPFAIIFIQYFLSDRLCIRGTISTLFGLRGLNFLVLTGLYLIFTLGSR